MPRPLLAVALILASSACRSGAEAAQRIEPAEGPQVLRPEQVRVQRSEDLPLAVPTDGFPTVGPANAPITLVEVTSFACPFCLKSRPALRTLRTEYGDRFRVVTRMNLIGEDALAPTLAACAAHKQGRFAAFAELVWQEAALDGHDFAPEHLAELAARAGLDVARFRADSAGAECRADVERDAAALRDIGLRATPTWVINGRVVRGARDVQQYRDIFNELLGSAPRAGS